MPESESEGLGKGSIQSEQSQKNEGDEDPLITQFEQNRERNLSSMEVKKERDCGVVKNKELEILLKNYEKTIDILSEENKKIEKEKNKRIDELLTTIQNYDMELTKMNRELTRIKGEYEKMKEKEHEDRNTVRIDTLQRETLHVLTEQLEQAGANLAKAEKINLEYKKTLENMEANETKLKQVIAELKETISNKEGEINKSKALRELTQNRNKVNFKELLQVKKYLEQLIKNAQSGLQKGMVDLDSKVGEKERELFNLQEAFNMKLKEIEERFNEANKEIEIAAKKDAELFEKEKEDKISELEHQNESLDYMIKQKNEYFNNQIKVLSEENERLEASNQNFKKQISEISQSFGQVKQESRIHLQNQITSSEAKLNKYKSQLQNLQGTF